RASCSHTAASARSVVTRLRRRTAARAVKSVSGHAERAAAVAVAHGASAEQPAGEPRAAGLELGADGARWDVGKVELEAAAQRHARAGAGRRDDGEREGESEQEPRTHDPPPRRGAWSGYGAPGRSPQWLEPEHCHSPFLRLPCAPGEGGTMMTKR